MRGRRPRAGRSVYSGGNPAVVSAGEPVFGQDPSDTMLINENFDSYASVAAFNTAGFGPGLHLTCTGDDFANFSFVTGRGGSGQALRIPYANVPGPSGQEINKIETTRDGHAFDEDAQNPISDLTFGKTTIVQDYRRLIAPGGFGTFDDCALKFMEFFQPDPDANLRQLFNTSNHGTYPSVWPHGAIWESIGKGESFYPDGPNAGLTADGKQSYSYPTVYDWITAQAFWKFTFMFRGHTSAAQKDGYARLWVNGYELIRIRQDVVNVPAPGGVGDGAGGTRPWCIQQDIDLLHLGNDGVTYNRSVSALVWYHQLLSFTGNNFDGGATGFTIDTDDVLVWTRG